MQDVRLLQSVDEPTAEELVGSALRRLLRGGTWEALAYELAWKSVRLTGAAPSCFEWLPALVEAHLSELVDGLEFTLERESRSAREEHLREWSHDYTGADTAALLAAQEEAERQVADLYLKVLEWTSALLSEHTSRSPNQRPAQLPGLCSEISPADLEVPELVADALDEPRPRYGWPTKPL